MRKENHCYQIRVWLKTQSKISDRNSMPNVAPNLVENLARVQQRDSYCLNNTTADAERCPFTGCQ